MKGGSSLHPSIQDLAWMLCRVSKDKKLPQLLRSHIYLCQIGLDFEASLATVLITSLAGAGRTGYAQQILNKMLGRDQHSMAALGMCQPDHGMTFDLYYKMRKDDSNFPIHGFVALFKACAASQDIERGYALHADIARLGLLKADVFVGSIMVDMYVKCGYVGKAQEVFDELLLRDVVSWTALIAGYAEHGPFEQAFDCATRMRHEGIPPNSYTMVCLLKACGHLEDIHKGEEVHTEITLIGVEGEELIGNSLVDMYSKCGHLPAAYAVFWNFRPQNVISWTALILGYINCGQSEEALDCYEQMQYCGCSSNIVTYLCTLKACTSINAIEKGQQIHTDIVFKGLEEDIRIGNTLLDMYFKCGLVVDAKTSFDKLPSQDVISWNILLAGYAECCSGEEALATFEEMRCKGFSADGATFVCLLRACSKLGSVHKGLKFHLTISKHGLDRKLLVANTLVDMYGKFGLLMEARHVFDKLPVQSLVSWNALIAGYADLAHAEEALQALQAFNQMQLDSFYPDAITCVCGLKACGNIENILKGQEIHLEIVKLGVEDEFRVGNSLIHMYAKCGSLAEAQEVFDKLLARDVVSWTALMEGWAQFGKTEVVLRTFDRMIAEGIPPSSITLTCVLNACSDEGVMFIDPNYLFFERSDSVLFPTIDHYTCVIDLLGRGGLVPMAMRLAKEMPMHPDIVMWLSVLGACRNWGNIEFGKLAFDKALELDKKSEAAYLCMYNIFVEACMFGEAYAVQDRRAEI